MAGMRTYVFIDGGHIRSGLTRIGASWESLNLRTMCEVLPSWVGGAWMRESMRVSRVFVYDAVPESGDDEGNLVEEWLKRNDRVMDVDVRYGRLAGEPQSRQRQKAVDVQLAVDALSFAVNDTYDVAILVTGDADFIPVVEAVRERGPLVCVCAFQESLSDELAKRADRVGPMPTDPKA